MDQGYINFAVYEDSTEYLGVAKAEMPSINWLNASMNGAGIAGNIEAVILGHIDAMTLTLNFRSITAESMKLTEPRRHNIDMRIARQDEDTVAGAIKATAIKNVFVVVPKSFKPGSVAPAAPSDGSGEYAVRYWATYIDGVKTLEIDPMNYICMVNGTDYLASVRTALGK